MGKTDVRVLKTWGNGVKGNREKGIGSLRHNTLLIIELSVKETT